MKKVIKIVGIVLIIIILIILAINCYVKVSTKEQIIEDNNYSDLKNIDCIIVLGAGIWGDKPSPMLEDRLLQAIELYKNNVSSKIIMSGDHGREDYDEVNTMKEFAIEKGIPSEDIFMDHAGFSSYESIYRAKEIFGAKKVIIVTQKYHLFRALYIANQLGLETYGVGADPRQYIGAAYRELREIFARNKDFIKCIFKPKPTFLGDTISVSGNGDVTNDNNITTSSNSNTITVNLQNNINTKETSINRTLDKVAMTIKEGTLTKTSATIIITDENEEPYGYDEWFRVDKKENKKWKEVKPINEDYVVNAIAWLVGDNGKLELKTDWSNLYGELESGEYRVVKKVYDNGYKYFSVEFTIN